MCLCFLLKHNRFKLYPSSNIYPGGICNQPKIDKWLPLWKYQSLYFQMGKRHFSQSEMDYKAQPWSRSCPAIPSKKVQVIACSSPEKLLQTHQYELDQVWRAIYAHFLSFSSHSVFFQPFLISFFFLLLCHCVQRSYWTLGGDRCCKYFRLGLKLHYFWHNSLRSSNQSR